MKKFLVLCVALSLFTASPGRADSPWQARAAQGDPAAQYNLALAYAKGTGVAKNNDEAFKWMQKAAGQGLPEAQMALGSFYGHGWGVAQNFEQARLWLQKAAAQNNPEAEFSLGKIYYDGYHVAKDRPQAMDWFRKSATLGFAPARDMLAQIEATQPANLAAAQPVQTQSAPKVLNLEAPGNLRSNFDTGCIAAGEVKNTYTPADLFEAAAHCVDAGKNDAGAFLFVTAGVYGYFDSLRVADKTAHQAVAVLKMNDFGMLEASKAAAFKASLAQILRPEKLAGVCRDLARLGPPAYFPAYMIQHGMNAFTGKNTQDGLVPGFNAGDAWAKALNGYAHCPKG